jgi:hypothetical protein
MKVNADFVFGIEFSHWGGISAIFIDPPTTVVGNFVDCINKIWLTRFPTYFFSRKNMCFDY